MTVSKQELISKLVKMYDAKHQHEKAMDIGFGYDFNKKVISLEVDGVTHSVLLKDLCDAAGIGDKKAEEIWCWVRSGPNSG